MIIVEILRKNRKGLVPFEVEEISKVWRGWSREGILFRGIFLCRGIEGPKGGENLGNAKDF